MGQTVALGRGYLREGVALLPAADRLSFCLLRAVTGGAVLSLGGQAYACSAGDLLLCRGGETVTASGIRRGEVFGYETVAFPFSFFCREGEKRETARLLGRFFSEDRRVGFSREGYLLVTLMDAVKKEAEDTELALSLIRSVLLAASRTPQVLSPETDRSLAVAAYVFAQYETPLDVESCAAFLGMSRSYTSRSFSSVFGFSLSFFIREVRLNAVCRRIAEGEGVMGAARACGFSSASGFYKAFAASRGCAPGKFCGSAARG